MTTTQLYNVSSSSGPIVLNQTLDDVDYELIHLTALREQFRTAASILAPQIALFGAIGNLVNIVVLTRRWLRSSTNCYLTALAGYDILYLISGSILMLKNLGNVNQNDVYMHIYWILRPLSNVFSNTATWLTVTFTVERYVGVSSPIKGRVICTVERAKCIITGVCIAAFLCTLPDFFEFELVQTTIANNVTVYRPHGTPAGDFLQKVGYYWIVPVLFTFTPLLLLIIFNSLLINSVLEASKFRRENANAEVGSDHRRERQQREQQRITTMLIAVVVVFLCLQLPSAILYVISKVYETDSLKELQRRRCASAVFNILVMINSSTNFILYSVFSTKFRNTFKRIFCKCWRETASEQLFSEMPNRGSRPSVCLRNSPNNSVNTAKNGYLQIGTKQDNYV